ncbi:MAG: ABC transporter substrate-binding protein [bacterium]
MPTRILVRFLTGLAAIAVLAVLVSAGVAGVSQAPPKPARIGVVGGGQRPMESPLVVGLRLGFRDLGYVDGRDVILKVRASGGRYETAVHAVRNLAGERVHVLVTAGTVATRAAKEAAGSLPIVFTQVGEPVAAGFVQSLAQPGGNMTGFSTLLPAATGKRLQLLRELVPGLRTVLVIFDPDNPTSSAAADVAREASERLRITLRVQHVKSREDVLAALQKIGRDTTDAILILPDSLVVNVGEQIITMSMAKRLPVMFYERTWVEQGGLASYGANYVDMARQAARYVDKILKGERPDDLPVQQPTKFELVINVRTATALGLTVPRALLLRADEVIR